MTEGKEMRLAGMKMSKRVALMVATTAVLVPAFAFAVETDRITVEDQTSGAVMFRVTSGGNVTGASFTGDGAGLTNVPHYKGAWSAATTYNKDETVNYNGSSYIALKQSLNADPTVDATSWAVFAQKGADGAAGAQGAAGVQGPQGPQGLQGLTGPAGSPDTQSQILTKIATQADGAAVVVQQGATEGVNAVKVAVKDTTGTNKFVVQSNGAVGIGTSAATYPVTIDSGIASAVPAGVGMVMLSGNTNKERIEVRSFGPVTDSAPTIQGKASQWLNGAPTSTLAGHILMSIGGSGYDNTGAAVIANRALLQMKAEEAWTPTAQGAYFGFTTTAPGTLAKAERMRISGNGNIGIGVVAPTQKLEVNGGVRLNTATAKPNCDSTIRGTFWVTQSGTGVSDALNVCIKDASDAYVWKAVW